MGYYVDLRFQKCGYSFTGGYARRGISSNLGLPIIVCPKCRTPHRTSQNVWSRMTTSERVSYVLSRVVQTLINAMPLAFLGIFGLEWLLKPKSDTGILTVIVGGALAGLALSALLIYLNSRHIIKKLEQQYANGKHKGRP